MDEADENPKRRGLMLVVCAPSGAGKSTLTRRLLEDDPHVALSVSVTTRPPRPGEEEGVHYFFRTREEFDRMVAGDELLEYAYVLGGDRGYGSPREAVERQLEKGIDVLFDIDWQGHRQLTEKAPDDVVSVYVLPPSAASLEQRLRTRGQDSDEVILQRMRAARSEMEHWPEFEYSIVNDDIDRAYNKLKAILVAERLKRNRRPGLAPFMENLYAELMERGHH